MEQLKEAVDLACKIVLEYGEGDWREHNAAQLGALWSDHPVVQGILAAWNQRSPSRWNEAIEAAAGVASEGNVHWRDKSAATANKRESRDYETMAIACVHVEASILALKEPSDAA